MKPLILLGIFVITLVVGLLVACSQPPRNEGPNSPIRVRKEVYVNGERKQSETSTIPPRRDP